MIDTSYKIVYACFLLAISTQCTTTNTSTVRGSSTVRSTSTVRSRGAASKVGTSANRVADATVAVSRGFGMGAAGGAGVHSKMNVGIKGDAHAKGDIHTKGGANPKVSSVAAPKISSADTLKVSPTTAPRPSFTAAPKPGSAAVPTSSSVAAPKVSSAAAPKPGPTPPPTVSASNTPRSSANATFTSSANAAPKSSSTNPPKVSANVTSTSSANAAPKASSSNSPKVSASTTPKVSASTIPKVSANATPTSSADAAPKASSTNPPKVSASNTPKATLTPKSSPTSAPKNDPGGNPKIYASTAPSVHATFETGIVFESYDVRRPEIAELPVAALRNELTKFGYVATPSDVMADLGSQLAWPAMTSKLTPKQLQMELEHAHAQWVNATDFGKAALMLSNAVTKALDNPALVVVDQTIRNNLQNALLDLALVSGKRARDAKHVADVKKLQASSEDSMAEWIRTFSGAEITQKLQGPEAEKLYTRVRNERDKFGRGALAVTVDDPDVQLYVNEEFQPSQHPITDLVPGRYRVLLMGPNSEDARLFKVEVVPNQTTHLDVQWALSSNLAVSTSSVGFVFTSATHHEASALACKLAHTTGHRDDGVVLVSMELEGKQWKVTASLYEEATCQLLRYGYVVLGNPATKDTGALARFITRGERAPDVVVTEEAPPSVFQKIASDRLTRTAVLVKPAPPPEPGHGLAWALAGGSAAMFAVGGYGLYSNNGIVGYGALGVGVALGALATYSFMNEERPSKESHVTIAPLHAGAVVGWSGRF